jgi:hypothetical protein
MSENIIRNEYDKIKTSELLVNLGCSAGPKKKLIYMIGI